MKIAANCSAFKNLAFQVHVKVCNPIPLTTKPLLICSSCKLVSHRGLISTIQHHYLSLVLRKPIVGVRHKPGCTVTDNAKRLEISDLGSRGIVLSV